MKSKALSIFLWLIVLITLSSCSKKDKITKAFKVISHKVQLKSKAASKERAQRNALINMFDDEAFISFYEDGHYTSLNKKGNYYTGEWQLDEAGPVLLKVHMENIGVVTFEVREDIDPDHGTRYLSLNGTSSGHLKVDMVLKEDGFYQNKGVDMLSVEMNWWRTPPDKKEGEAQIKKRMLAQLEFMIQYFKMIGDKELDSFYVTHLQSPILFYSNGLELDPDDATLERTYYDPEDAMIAREYLTKGIKSMSTYPADAKSYTKGYYNALKEISKAIALM
ncbi:MAG TPA: hypothetical protein VL947_05375 [Cytophagales bacterium]|nr:hypothetical protein [Cytophagales bacterium]